MSDFKSRAEFAPGDVHYHCKRGWPYIPVHEFADDTRKTVPGVDCWCLIGPDAALLECVSQDVSSKATGLYARVDAGPPYWPKLFAVLRDPITRVVVENTMEAFAELGFPDTLILRLQPGDSLLRLTP